MSSESAVQSQYVVTRFVPLAHLAESPTNPRKHFDPGKLEELALNIKEVGVLEPLLVREVLGRDALEIICGARRYRASKIAGFTEVPVIVRDFTDDQVRLVQLAENAAREDLSPVEEAEAYAALIAEGMSLGAIAQTLGRKTREVARRLPLAKLPKRVKDALASGLITAGHSEYLARIPDAKLQEEALGRFLYDANRDRDGKPIIAAVPLAVAKRIIEEEFMTSLSVAVFDPEDATLSPLGACSKCPHLAGNNPDLFGDVRAKAVCTNPKDFRLKIENHLARLRGSGYTVLLSKNELKHAFPFGESDELGKEFVDLEHMCVDDPKGRPYEELLGRGEKLATVFALKNGRMRKLYPAKEIKSALVASGHAFAKERKPQPGNGKGNGKAFRSEARDERIVAEAVARELAANLRRVKQSPREWTDLLVRIVILSYGGRLERVFRRHGYDGTSEEFATKRERVIAGRLAAMTDAEKRALMIDLLAGDWGSVPVEKPLQALYRELLKLAGVDAVAVGKAALENAKRDAATPKAAPATKGGAAKRAARAV